TVRARCAATPISVLSSRAGSPTCSCSLRIPSPTSRTSAASSASYATAPGERGSLIAERLASSDSTCRGAVMGGEDDYRRRSIDGHVLHPETMMMGYGYAPSLSEGAL